MGVNVDDDELVTVNNNREDADIRSFRVIDYEELRPDETVLYDIGSAGKNMKKSGYKKFILSELSSEYDDRLTAFGTEVAGKRPSRGAGTPTTKTWLGAQKEIRDKIVSSRTTTSSLLRPLIRSHSQFSLTAKNDCLAEFDGSSPADIKREYSRRRLLHDLPTQQAMIYAMVGAQHKFPNNHQLQDEYCAKLKKERTKALQVSKEEGVIYYLVCFNCMYYLPQSCRSPQPTITEHVQRTSSKEQKPCWQNS